MDIYKKALDKIENDQKCKPNGFSVIGPTGPTETYKSVSK